jgi:ribonuclease Y
MEVDPIFLMLSGTALGAAAAYGFARSKYQALLVEEVRGREPQLEKVRSQERDRQEKLTREANEQIEAVRGEAEELRRSLEDTRRQAAQREEYVTKKGAELEKLESAILVKETAAITAHREAAELVNAQRARLEALAGMNGEEARRRLMSEILDGIRSDVGKEAKAIEDAARAEADARAQRILGLAIQRFASDSVQERAVTTVHLPSDDMKGRIIGREGRNIRALQEACGVDIIIDETPETILISGFDPVRREVARLALEKLVLDGRIQPSRIEEEVHAAQQAVEKGLEEAANKAMLDLGVLSVHPEIVKLLGRLHHRFSLGQNVLRHSVECAFLTGMMAVELGLDEKVARRVGLLHDIGKAVSHEQEGGHAVIGGQLARKYGESPLVVNGIAAHHEDEPATSVIANLVIAADAISGARPGARREVLEGYVKRLRDLEVISTRFAGVERAFALQAGREVRVFVEPSEVSDSEAVLLAREITKRIEEELSYPGQIRVTVIRETRAIDYAK